MYKNLASAFFLGIKLHDNAKIEWKFGVLYIHMRYIKYLRSAQIKSQKMAKLAYYFC